MIPPAFAHPAKISLALVKKIFAHALELGWIRKGDTCVDPFAGVGGVAFGAMAAGLNFIGQELESHFVDLVNGVKCTGISKADWVRFYGRWEKANRRDGRHWCPNCLAQAKQIVEPKVQTDDLFGAPAVASYECNSGKIPSTLPHRFEGNLEFWKRKFGLSGAVIMQGDSRKLLENLRGRVECVVSSPPFLDAGRGDKRFGGGIKDLSNLHTGSNPLGGLSNYGDSSNNLGNLPVGNFDAVISSPPYAGNEKSDYHLSEDGKTRRRDEGRGYQQGAGCFRGSETYGKSAGQLGAMRDKDFDLVVSSPPYVKSVHGGNGIDASKLTGNPAGPNSQAFAGGYGESPAQLAAMPEGCFDIAVSRPPFEDMEMGCNSQAVRRDLTAQGRSPEVTFGKFDGQLGGSGETFWIAAREIVQQCFLALKPGGHAIWVVKDFLRNGRRVEFCEQWRLLCETVGFKTTCTHRAMLVTEITGQQTLAGKIEKKVIKRSSFFRKLSEKSAKAKAFFESLGEDEKKSWIEKTRAKFHNLSESRILQRARLEAYKAHGEPEPKEQLDVVIDWEMVICMVKV